MEVFANIVNGLKPLTICVTIFAKKLPLRCLLGSNYASGIIIICNFIQVYTLPFEFIKAILKAFEKFARALCPFAGDYFKKQTSAYVCRKYVLVDTDLGDDFYCSKCSALHSEISFCLCKYCSYGSSLCCFKSKIPFALIFFCLQLI